MKIKEGMVLRAVAGHYVAVPTGKAIKDFSGLVRLNETGHDVWEGISEGLTVHEIAEKLVKEYADVTLEVAEQTTQALVDQLTAEGLVLPD